MDTALDDLKARLLEVRDLRAAAAVLHWDQATYMPPGGAPARGRQLATLRRLAQEKFTDPAVGRLLDTLEPWAADQDPDGDTARLVRVTRWDYDRAVRIPVDLVAEMSRHGAAACQAWTVARPANDFAAVQPYLERSLALSHRFSACFPEFLHPADVFVDFAEPGMTVAKVRAVFAELRAALVPLVRAVTARPMADLPAAWRARYEADLGVTPPDDRGGVLQDVHWYGGTIGGAFHGYTLGNIMAAQFYQAALTAHPAIPAEITGGEFGTLRGWLTDNVYRHGRKFWAEELLPRATGQSLTIEPYMRYLRGKYGQLYELA